MIIVIELAMMTRAVKRVFVEVPDGFLNSRDHTKAIEDDPPLKQLMGDIYELDEGMGFELDDQWGVEEGTHSFLAYCVGEGAAEPFPDYRLNEDGEVELVETDTSDEVLLKLSDCLWPCGDKDNEWDSDTIDFVARTLIEAGYGPKEASEKRRLCSVCGESQFDTSHGITCYNGHGGADTVYEWPVKKEEGDSEGTS